MLSITKMFGLSVALVAALSFTSGAEVQAGGGGGHGWSGGHGGSGGHRSYSHSVVQNRHHYQAPRVHHAIQNYYTPQYAPVQYAPVHHNRVQYNYHAPQAIQHGYQHVVRPRHYSTHRSGHFSH